MPTTHPRNHPTSKVNANHMPRTIPGLSKCMHHMHEPLSISIKCKRHNAHKQWHTSTPHVHHHNSTTNNLHVYSSDQTQTLLHNKHMLTQAGTDQLSTPLLPPHLHPQPIQLRLLRNPSPERPDLHGPRRTHPPPSLHPRTNARRHAWHT